jgi:hypothetical protein
MSEQDRNPIASNDAAWEARAAQTAKGLAFPPTPNLAGQLGARRIAALVQSHRERRAQQVRRLTFAAIVLIGLSLALLSVPSVQAALVRLLRLGSVTIVLVPTPMPTLTPTTPSTPPPPPLSSVLDLSGETTLAQARASVSFSITLPTYPANLGPPDAMFVQDLGDETVMLVWRDSTSPNRVRLALQLLGPNAFVFKMQPRKVADARVNGQPALWAVGEYMLRTRIGDPELRRLITGSVLIWKEGNITYRLETDLPMEDAVKIAESLR